MPAVAPLVYSSRVPLRAGPGRGYRIDTYYRRLGGGAAERSERRGPPGKLFRLVRACVCAVIVKWK